MSDETLHKKLADLSIDLAQTTLVITKRQTELAIDATPTSEKRNLITEANIFIAMAQEKLTKAQAL